jgi:alpha-tubulin suppressor-like RCC1 family protein
MKAPRRAILLACAAVAISTACGSEGDARDAGTVDSGLTDAGVTDAAVTDSGATDAGPTDAGPLRAVALSAASAAHACAVLSDGAVRCWGVNDLGQLGVERAESRQQCRVPQSSPARSLPCETTPRDVPNLTDVAEVAAGNGGTCALKRDGSVWCWGANDAGQLGQGTNDAQAHGAPVRVNIPPASQLTYGAFHVCALLLDGNVQCWGTNKFGQCGAAPAMSGAQCDPGDGITAPCVRSPRAVPGLAAVRAVSAGRNHTCALLGDETVRCWGLNDSAQLGNGMVEAETSPRHVPVAVTGLTNVARIAAGGSHTCAVLADGAVRCWGWGDLGQLGGAATTSCTVGSSSPCRCADGPAAVPELTGVYDLVGGTLAHLRVPDRTGRAPLRARRRRPARPRQPELDQCCSFSFDRLPLLPHLHRAAPSPPPASVSVGDYHSCALMADGAVRCWGNNSFGQLGNGATDDQNAPVSVRLVP